jgi:hypothetical protein
MQVIDNYVCKDIYGIIEDYLCGDKKYWKSKFNSVLESLVDRRKNKYMTISVPTIISSDVKLLERFRFNAIKYANLFCYRGVRLAIEGPKPTERTFTHNIDWDFNIGIPKSVEDMINILNNLYNVEFF